MLLGPSGEQERCLLSFVWWRQQLSKRSGRLAAGSYIPASRSSHLLPLGGRLTGLVAFLVWCISPSFSVISLKREKGRGIFHLKGNQSPRLWLQGQQGGMCTVPAEQGRVCAPQPGFLTPCSTWLWCRHVYFPHGLSGGSRRVGEPKLPEKPGGSTVGLWLVG